MKSICLFAFLLSFALVVVADLRAPEVGDELKNVAGKENFVRGDFQSVIRSPAFTYCYDVLTTCVNAYGFTATEIDTLEGIFQGQTTFGGSFDQLNPDFGGLWTAGFSTSGFTWYTTWAMAATCSCSTGDIFVVKQ